jgi:hypothetical protein
MTAPGRGADRALQRFLALFGESIHLHCETTGRAAVFAANGLKLSRRSRGARPPKHTKSVRETRPSRSQSRVICATRSDYART